MTDATSHGIPIRRFALMLAVLSAVVWMGTTIYVPGLPLLETELGMGGIEASATLTVYYLGFAAFLLLVGPLTEAYGRRVFLLLGLALSLCGSVMCAVAQESVLLYCGRFVMGCGAGFVQTPVLAMVRDVCKGRAVYAALGLLGALTGIIPVCSMLLGGVICDVWGWRPVFMVMAVTAAGGFLFCLFRVRETLPKNRRVNKIKKVLENARTYAAILFSSQVFIVNAPALLSVMALGAFLATAPFVFDKTFNLSSTMLGVGNIFIALSMAGGQYAISRLIKCYDPPLLFRISSLPALTGGLGYAFLFWGGAMDSPVGFLLPVVIFLFSFGLMEPVGLKSLLTAFDAKPGMASSMYSFLLLIMQGVGSLLAGALMHGAISPLESLMLILSPVGAVMAALAWSGAKRLH